MITIKQSKSADSRTATGEVTKRELYESSFQHISDVTQAMCFFVRKMLEAAEKHDHTKIDTAGINAFYDSFSKGLKGEDFKKEPWFQRHISEERHHLNDRVPEDVNLIDVFERISDIVMAAMGRSGEFKGDTLSDEVLQKAYQNTIKLLLENVKVEA